MRMWRVNTEHHHTAPGLHQHMHTYVPSPWRCVGGRGNGWGVEEEVSCPYLDLHLDLQVSPVDGEQCAVRAGGAQLPGAVGHVPVAVSQEDQRGEGEDLAGEGTLLCRRGEGRGTAFHMHTHSHLTHTLCKWCELMFHSHSLLLCFKDHKSPTHVDVHPHCTQPC